MIELFPLPFEGVLLPTRSATSRYLKTEYAVMIFVVLAG